ncbi:serine/threonine kinase-like domain-containing protein STKLD1 [Chanos chanos]|uniref:non-specific serine/threonine protein kinase n=1 Tax=Chanos chanos TaxID=29144 RepID=A0A6J2UMZ3_CHACN|nr:serine/threonine kinase-like domain-containing protein STKLD1 [Chanos chanos]
MENYVVLDAMCPRSTGTTLFVEDRGSGSERTLKKVECLDEGAANQALQEALCLLQLSHSNIVKYREMFISWDKSISSVILSMVMDCPYTTTLSDAICYHREQRQTFDNKVIQLFLGQMVDALTYLHRHNIVHRNLKPSNVLMDEGPSFRMFDFGTASILEDRLETLKWIKCSELANACMAPESVTQRQWTEKTDVWSLGCILLDMLTCHVVDVETSQNQLFQIKESLSTLNIVTSKDFHLLLTMMFDPNPQTRINVWELVNEDVVKQCLTICGSTLHVVKKSLPPGVAGPPFTEGFDKVLEFMQIHSYVQSVQNSVLSYLLEEEKKVLDRASDVVKSVSSAMLNHLDCAEIQLKSCQLLQRCLPAGKSIETYPTHTDLLTRTFQILNLISGDEETAEEIVEQGGVQEVVKTLKAYPENAEMANLCLKCLKNALTQGGSAIESVGGVVETVCLVGETHLQNEAVTERVCAVLKSLTRLGLSEDKHIEDSVFVLMHSLSIHASQSRIMNDIFIALASLVSVSALAARRLLFTSSGGSGIALLKEARLKHPGDPEVSENVCRLWDMLTQYDDMIPELLVENVEEDLSQLLTEFALNKEITRLTQQTILRLKSLDDEETTISA